MTADTRYGVGPLGYWLGCFRRYAAFAGRARRAEYWWFTLINGIIFAALVGVGIFVEDSGESSPALGRLILVFFFAGLLPTLAVTCRRLHDAGLSGWWQLLGFIPLGSLVVLIMTVLDSDPGVNRYGPDPR
ncbi:DUF805 domain-containing protein [Actinoplanes sp. NPDC049668]|uniref:DUF805 domain-containing protein n=1 Tax=unclassified Actinoplanes TaxID=2626549 RepID=UPI0033A1C62A